MGTPLGDFVRASRDAVQPESLGLPTPARRRSPGLRRTDLAARAGISVEYLTRIEQGRDRNPSISVVNALADALSLATPERAHLRYLAKITGGECAGHAGPAPVARAAAPTVRATLRQLEPAVALVTNRAGDVLATTPAFDAVLGASGLLEHEAPNLTRYVFTDPRARDLFTDWDAVADELAFDLWKGPTIESAEWLAAEIAPAAGPELTRRQDRHTVPPRGVLRLRHPDAGPLAFDRQFLEVPDAAQQVVVHHPADVRTAEAVEALLRRGEGGLHVVPRTSTG